MTAQLDPDRLLALAYAPGHSRPGLESLWRLDVTLGAILAGGRQKMVSQIRLAWWREALERLDSAPPPPEPLLQALAMHLLPAGITGASLAEMEEGWRVLLTDAPLDAEALRSHGHARGALLFRHSARLLGGEGEVDAAGARWALVDLARHSSNAAEAAAAWKAAADIAGESIWPRALRPLAMLSLLARRDVVRHAAALERQGAPARMIRLFKYRLTGR